MVLPVQDVMALEIRDRPFPEIVKAPVTKRPAEPRQPPGELCEKVEAKLKTWEHCFGEEAARRFKRAIAAAKFDDEQLAAEEPAHRRRFESGEEG